VIALEQRGHFLAGGAEELRDLEDPNSCQQLPLSHVVQACRPASTRT
jgi:hypothetical protein